MSRGSRLSVLILVVALVIGLGWWFAPTPVTSGSNIDGVVKDVPVSDEVRRRHELTIRRAKHDRDAASNREVADKPTTPGPAERRELEDLGYLEPEAPEDPGLIAVWITDSRGHIVEEAGLAIGGDCGRRRYRVTEGEGELEVMPGPCRLVAWRADGALRTQSEPVEVLVRPGEAVDAFLTLPWERTGGLGVQIEQIDEGVLVTWVLPGSPAEEAGLQEGDVITEVDGTPSAVLTLQEFQQVMTGPEGTDIDFVVSYDDGQGLVEEPVSIVRAFLEG